MTKRQRDRQRKERRTETSTRIRGAKIRQGKRGNVTFLLPQVFFFATKEKTTTKGPRQEDPAGTDSISVMSCVLRVADSPQLSWIYE